MIEIVKHIKIGGYEAVVSLSMMFQGILCNDVMNKPRIC